jgi:hypothetical protein
MGHKRALRGKARLETPEKKRAARLNAALRRLATVRDPRGVQGDWTHGQLLRDRIHRRTGAQGWRVVSPDILSQRNKRYSAYKIDLHGLIWDRCKITHSR